MERQRGQRPTANAEPEVKSTICSPTGEASPRASRLVTWGLLLTGVALLVAPGGCRNRGGGAASPANDSVSTAPVVVLHPGDRRVPFRVELALTEEQRERGLMFRNHLDEDAGMLFVFAAPTRLVFWMKNTFIPLDMIFIGPDQRIVGIVEDATPRTETPRSVPGQSQFVLEISGGLSRRLGLAPGQPVDFQGVPLPP